MIPAETPACPACGSTEPDCEPGCEAVPARMTTDRYGRRWALPSGELCSTCGQPDNCGDCSHEPLSAEDVLELGGSLA